MEPDFKIGRSVLLTEGSDVCIIACGTITPVAMAAADQLRASGISTRVVNMHTVKPLDEKMLEDIFTRFRIVSTLEEHSLLGGFGSAVAEWLIDRDYKSVSLIRFGVPDTFLSRTGSQDLARRLIRLTPENVAERITNAMKSIPVSG